MEQVFLNFLPKMVRVHNKVLLLGIFKMSTSSKGPSKARGRSEFAFAFRSALIRIQSGQEGPM